MQQPTPSEQLQNNKALVQSGIFILAGAAAAFVWFTEFFNRYIGMPYDQTQMLLSGTMAVVLFLIAFDRGGKAIIKHRKRAQTMTEEQIKSEVEKGNRKWLPFALAIIIIYVVYSIITRPHEWIDYGTYILIIIAIGVKLLQGRKKLSG